MPFDEDPPPPRANRRQAAGRAGRGLAERLSDPKNAVVVVLGAVVAIGGGRRLLQAWQARRAVGRLERDDVTPAEVEAAASAGRGGLMDLFRLLGTAKDPAVRDAAGRALSVLWAQDQLIAEEEKAVVTRGFRVDWRARRRYPRELQRPFPVEVVYGVPFLRAGSGGVGPDHLEWSYRVAGTHRAHLEKPSPWAPGPCRLVFEVDPGDYPADGPHRLILQARARTRGLTGAWEHDLPHVPFAFEFDPRLRVDSLLTLPDDSRGEALARAVRLEPPEELAEPRFLPLNPGFALRNPPDLAVLAPLPCDLAHEVALEFEGIPGRFAAGTLVVASEAPSRTVPLGPVGPLPADAFDRPGDRRVRAHLTTDPHLGWADPDVRSLWPGTLTTDWAPAQVVRR